MSTAPSDVDAELTEVMVDRAGESTFLVPVDSKLPHSVTAVILISRLSDNSKIEI